MASIFTRRVVAYVLDFFVVAAIMWIVSYLLYFIMNPYETYKVYMYFPYVAPVLGFLYFVVCEKTKDATIGKALMYLQVRSRNGARINWAQSLVRNLTKIFWFPIIFDWALGRVFGANDRLFGAITKSVVMNEFE